MTLLVKDANTTTQSTSTQSYQAGNLVPVNIPPALNTGGHAIPVIPSAPLPVINAAGAVPADGSGTVMRRLILALSLVAFAASFFQSGSRAAAQAYVPGDYSAISYAGSTTVTTGGTAQSVAWSLTQAKIRCVQNPKSATEELFVSYGTAATTTASHDLQAGSQICWPWNGAVSVYAATTGHAFVVFEAQ